MIIKGISFAACLLLLLAAPVLSAEKTPVKTSPEKAAPACEGGLTKAFLDRLNSACKDQPLRDCYRAETERQDARLNKAYTKLMAGLSPARKKQLREAQRLWMQYRDANCNFRADPEGGTITYDFAAYCVMKETTLRADELEHLREAEY